MLSTGAGLSALTLAADLANGADAVGVGEQNKNRKKPAIGPVRAGINDQHFIDVTLADGVYVKEPLLRADAYDENTARENTRRIHSILTSQSVASNCLIYFPAGVYFFDGAGPGWDASIQTTHPRQTIAGDGMNATIIAQKNTSLAATVKIHHDACTIRDLQVRSADLSAVYQPDWDQNRHRAAIWLDAPGKAWKADPQILDVNINTSGNNVAFKDFHRPFETGVKATGPWLDIYVHTLWMRDVKNGIDLDQGAFIGGPAHFIDVNFVATSQQVYRGWTTFLRSQSRFMEVVKIIDCFFIGSQFIHMEGRPTGKDEKHNPAYTIVIDHNYMNTLWGDAGDEARYSGIYMNLPPSPDGRSYSRNICFTNNYVAGRAPKHGAFFHLQGVCRGIDISNNFIGSGRSGKCIQVLPGQPIGPGDVAMRDIRITENYICDYRRAITIGGDDSLGWTEGISIAGNQTFFHPSPNPIGETTVDLIRARAASVVGNAFAETAGSSLIARQCERLSISDNQINGLGSERSPRGIALEDSRDVTITGNHVRGFERAVSLEGSDRVTAGSNAFGDAASGVKADQTRCLVIHGNNLDKCETGLALSWVEGLNVNGNTLHHCKTAVSIRNTKGALLNGNQMIDCATPVQIDHLDQCSLVGNMALDSGPAKIAGAKEGWTFSLNQGIEGIE
jgi:hypothetical protein